MTAGRSARAGSRRIAIALDGLDGPAALAIVDLLGDLAPLHKVGPALLLESGPGILSALRARGRSVFLDLKFHDIPQTVGSAVAQAVRTGVSLLTVHALGGRAMLRAARAAVPAGSETRLLAVTILTSLDAEALRDTLGDPGADPARAALRLARIAREEGMDGIVASPLEARVLREALGPDALLVTPGIRGAGAATEDQKRTLSAREAIREGADILVVGRPVVRASSPRNALLEILEEIEQVAQ